MTTPALAVGVNAVILDAQRRLLLTRRVDNGRWWVPCGHLEVGEQPAAAAVVREVLEETGVSGSNGSTWPRYRSCIPN